ncbi:NAC domain [Macleaya cordata]|uniref:NAC domain n=1 Tax=Macleaya cordata TaxID=56857 RepID=A0A200QGU2_MACCD|nr:NAC domain [Macleaya cordata]
MENINFVRNGVIRLPPGFRFHPTDEELVVQYLKRKVFACPLPASIIPEYDPWDLPGDWEQERYYFSTREAKYRNGNRTNRATGSGYWKATGIDKQIVAPRSNQVVGMKKTLVFYRGKPPNGSRTDWIMHEYRLAGAGTKSSISSQSKSSIQNSVVQMEDWVLCRIFLKKRNSKNDDEIANRVTRPGYIDFMNEKKTDVRPSSSSSSSSASSGVTDVSSTASDNDENSSCNSISLSSCREKKP